MCATSTRRSPSSRGRTRRTEASRSTHGTRRSSGSSPTTCGASSRSTSAGSSSATAASRTWTTRSTRPSTTAGFPARASSRSASMSPSAARSATTARGASRSSRTSCGTCRSSRSSTEPTRRPSRRSPRRGVWVSDNGLSKERLIWMFTQMARIREFEESVKRTFEDHPGVIRGHTHLADGAEASIVGSIAAMRPDDQLLTTYRCHGYPLALGTDPKAMMAEIYGKETGLCKGYGGSMHLVDVERGFLGTSGIVAQGIPHATGAAWAAQIRGKGQVVLGFFGDGASKQGAFHESLNIASLWKLPIVYVMENNSYNVVTRVEQEDANAAAGEPLSVKAKAYSMPGVTVDGGDPIEVYEHVSAAAERARSGEGPTLVESRVYRLSAHGNIIAPPGVPLHFPEHEAVTVFGATEEYEAALRGDPVPRFRGRLVTDGTLTAEEADAIAEAAREEMQAAVDFGLESPHPAPEKAIE